MSKYSNFVSVIMSVYNCEEFLNCSIQSIIDQTHQSFEFIIVNDKSTDKSEEIINNWKKKDARIILLNNIKNIGLTKSLNKAILMAKGDIIFRMDADDISKPFRLSDQLSYMQTNDVDILGTYAENIDNNNNILGIRTVPVLNKDIYKMSILLNPMIHPSVCFVKSKIINIGLYNEAYNKIQDYQLWFIAMKHKLKFYNIPKVMLSYRINQNHNLKKSFSYRLSEFKIRREGFKATNQPFYKGIFLFFPFIIFLIPKNLHNILSKFDPR